MKQTLRIIGGQFRGKKFAFPELEGLRPTPDRVRETLFNWLMQDIREASCLDAFAGSGALGFEAFSRGAKKVLFLETAAAAAQQLQKNIQDFNRSALTLLKKDACNFLAESKESFDIIFLDPPFAKNLLPLCLEKIVRGRVLATGGLVYIESGEMPVLDPALWKCIHLKKAGQVYYGLISRASIDNSPASCFNQS